MEKRVYNFSAGPAVLPISVLEEAQRDLVTLPGVGSSVLEISHRSEPFSQIIAKAEGNLRQLLAIPDNYRVLFLQGGAQLQFAMLPMNLLGTDKTADYILTGSWGKKAIKEAQIQGKTRVAYDGQSTEYRHIPSADELELDPNAAYVHITSNETIQGIQFCREPEVGEVPLVSDSSSDILSRPLPVERYGVLFACAQKNAGPAGVTIVIIREDLLERTPRNLPAMLDYRALAEKKSLLNTPPAFSIYMVKLVTDWLLNEVGGLARMETRNRQKAQLLYDCIDASAGFYAGHADPDCRSKMNVTFRLPSPELEARFIREAEVLGLSSLKGHRSVGGCRASIYNAMPFEGVESLRDFMQEFARKEG